MAKDWKRYDVRVTVLVFRGGSAPSKITLARAVGVAFVPIERKSRRVAVGLVAPEQMRPEQPPPVTVRVSEPASKQAHAQCDSRPASAPSRRIARSRMSLQGWPQVRRRWSA